MAGIGYAFISAYLKGEEAKMLSSEDLNAVMKAAGLQEVIDSVRETDIGGYLEGMEINTFNEVDEYLWKYFSECLDRIEWFKGVPKEARSILRAYSCRYDILNIKTALQNIVAGEKTKGIPAGTIYNKGLLEELLDADNLDEVIGTINTCGMGEYANVIESYRLEEGFRKDILTDTGMERVYFNDLLKITRKIKDGAVLANVFRTSLDMTNLQVVLRAVVSGSDSSASGQTIDGGYLLSDELLREMLSAKLADIPSRLEYDDYRSAVEEITAGYEKTGDVSVINETLEKYKFRLISEVISPRIMSPAVVIWYLILKEIEIRNLRLVFKAVMDDIRLEEIRDYLVFT